MNADAALAELEALATKLDVTVSYDALSRDGTGSGGLCRVKGAWRVIIDRRGSPAEKASILARALGHFDLEPHFVSPSVRSLLEQSQR